MVNRASVAEPVEVGWIPSADRLRATLKELWPDASRDLLYQAFHFVKEYAHLRHTLRQKQFAMRVPPGSERVHRRSSESARNRLLEMGLSENEIEKLRALYELGDDLVRDMNAWLEAIRERGCPMCRHYFMSRERWLMSDEEEPFVPPGHCLVYGVIPFICRDFSPTFYCSGCGNRITLEEANTDGFNAAKCPACWSE